MDDLVQKFRKNFSYCDKDLISLQALSIYVTYLCEGYCEQEFSISEWMTGERQLLHLGGQGRGLQGCDHAAPAQEPREEHDEKIRHSLLLQQLPPLQGQKLSQIYQIP